VAEPQGGPADVDDVVAVLDGKHAGAWRRIVERIDERTYVVDPPLPIDEFIPTISIADNGFISETFEGNTIDAMGSKKAAGFVLAGHHYGTRVANNTVRGCGEAFRIVACPTEAPVHWGWSHAPVFGLRFEGNRIEKATRGATLAVEHGPPVKSSRGRLYFEGAASGNRFSPASPGLSIEGLEGEIRVERR
jgi:hypothetical protein